MCTYISVTLPETADIESCREAFDRNGLALNPAEPSDRPFGVLDSEGYFFSCSAYCDCGTRIGAAHGNADSQEFDREASLCANLRKKGWSEAKIKRRLIDLKRDDEKRERTEGARSEVGKNEVESWLNLIADLLERQMTSHVGITVNDYSGRISDARIRLERTTLSRSRLTANILEELGPAELLVIN